MPKQLDSKIRIKIKSKTTQRNQNQHSTQMVHGQSPTTLDSNLNNSKEAQRKRSMMIQAKRQSKRQASPLESTKLGHKRNNMTSTMGQLGSTGDNSKH